MKNKLHSLLILACSILLSSCGTASYYSVAVFDDGIYYRPTKDSRMKMVAATREHYELEQAALKESDYSTYLAKDDDGHLYLINEYPDGESYEARLHKFDSPVYTLRLDFGIWDYPWYNPWWGSFRYPYHSLAYNSWRLRFYDPWYYDTFYGWYDPWYYDPFYWGNPHYYGYYYGWHSPVPPPPHKPGIGPGPGPGGHGPEHHRDNVVYTRRSTDNGGGMYRRTSGGTYDPASGRRTVSTSSGTSGSIRNSSGNLSTTRTGNSVRNSVTTSSGQQRSVRTVRSSAGTNNSASYRTSAPVTRSSGTYSSSSSSSSSTSSGSRSSGNSGGNGHRR